MKHVRHLIVIPAYNEEQALPRTLADLQSLPDNFEVLVVNDGSNDQTGAIADRLSQTSRLVVHVINLPVNCGIGVAVQTAYLFAADQGTYQYVIQFDADGQHDAGYIPALVDESDTKTLDLCVGSRFLGMKQGTFRSTFARRIGIRFFSALIGALTGIRVTDPTSGFRCAGPRAWKSFSRHYPEDYPEPESLFWCARNKLRIGEILVGMHERQGGVSSIRYFKIVYYMVKVSLAILLDRVRAKERLPK